MMRMNGQNDSGESSGTEVDDMIETENTTLRERVSDLEKKVLEQGDEIICLRSTLANVVRRLEQVEGYPRTTPDTGYRYGMGAVKNGSVRSLASKGNLRRPGYTTIPVTDASKELLTRSVSVSSSGLPQRRQVHYQSTGSLHSGQSNHSESHSSSSMSPVPTSPSPTQSNPPNYHQSGILRYSGATTPTGVNSQSFRLIEPHRSVSQTSTPIRTNSNLQNSRRWSSTGDFGATPQSPGANQGVGFSRSSTKSLLNLYPRPQPVGSHNQFGPQAKHGTREVTYSEDGVLKMYLRGRPVNLYSPTSIVETYDVNNVSKAPSERLKLDWVYGYRGRDCRSNLYFLPTGEMVYFVAAAVVLYNVEEQSQRHYLGHTDDVKCLAVHPNKMLVATGQCAGHDRRDARPHVRIWNSVSLHTVAVIGANEFERSVCCISFSKADGGSLLCAIDESTDHTITVWDWQKGERGSKITENKCSVDTVIAAEFHPLERHCIVTCGKSHISFWMMDQNGTLYKRMGIFENRDKPKYVTCLAFTQSGDTLSGDSNGNIIVWGRGTNTIVKLIRGVHEGAIFSLCALKDGSVVSGGGKDGRLVFLDSELERTGEETSIGVHGGVRQVSEARGSQLLVGTTKNSILIGSITLGLSPVVLGHTEEVWACAAHPNLPQFVTAGFEGFVHLWDSMAHSLIRSHDIGEPVQSACFSPDGTIIILGLVTGQWYVLDSMLQDMLQSHQDGSEPIQDVKFSPDGAMLALASRDNTIYIYQVSEDFAKYSRVGRCVPARKRKRSVYSFYTVGHSSFITHIDWSSDSQFIRSNSGDYELLYWQADICRQIPQPSSMRDTEWATHNCTITFQTIGIWPEGADGTDVNNCARSGDCRLLVTADDFGKVKLYNYPVTQPKSLCHVMGAHSSHVTRVEFLHGDSRIISTGGKDTSVMQWRIS